MKSIRLLLGVAIVFVGVKISANNIIISNVTSVTGNSYVQLQFDLSWENSWNNSINHDAAWVFFKFKDNDGTWRPLHLTNTNNSITSGNTITVPTDLTGAFIYRNSGSGTLALTGILIGVENLPGNFDVKGFAFEMVQIPMNNSYYLGDGETGFNYYSSGSTTLPFLVNANTITMGTTTGLLNDGILNGTLSASFPIAYNSSNAVQLYMMKHEISQAAYREFLNTLTYDQQISRTAVAPNSAAGTMAIGLIARRNSIQIMTSGVANTTPAVYACNLNNNGIFNEATDGEWIACNYLSYMDVAAFLDWAALRPMTELEFEKSCRGPLYPVNSENASGTSSFNGATALSYSNLGAANESVTSYTGSVYIANITHNGIALSSSPTRVGIHATPYATRISAGAGYYGCLDLSGNIEEITVATCTAAGRSYTGLSGDGILNTAGDANTDYWPGINGNSTATAANTVYGGLTGVTAAAGTSGRGGACGYSPLTLIKTSYRQSPSNTSSRSNVTGGRGVKSF